MTHILTIDNHPTPRILERSADRREEARYVRDRPSKNHRGTCAETKNNHLYRIPRAAAVISVTSRADG